MGHTLGTSAEVAGHEAIPLMPPTEIVVVGPSPAPLEVQVLCGGSSSCAGSVLIVGSELALCVWPA